MVCGLPVATAWSRAEMDDCGSPADSPGDFVRVDGDEGGCEDRAEDCPRGGNDRW